MPWRTVACRGLPNGTVDKTIFVFHDIMWPSIRLANKSPSFTAKPDLFQQPKPILHLTTKSERLYENLSDRASVSILQEALSVRSSVQLDFRRSVYPSVRPSVVRMFHLLSGGN